MTCTRFKLESPIISDLEFTDEEIQTEINPPSYLTPSEHNPGNQTNANVGTSKQAIIVQLSQMKDAVIDSLRTHIPLSQLHADLDEIRDVNYVDLLEWRLEHYPSI